MNSTVSTGSKLEVAAQSEVATQPEVATQVDVATQVAATPQVEATSQAEATTHPETSAQPDSLPTKDLPITTNDLGQFLLTLTKTTSLTSPDIAKIRANTKYWDELLTIQIHAAELKKALDTPPLSHENDAENFDRVYAIANLDEFEELKEFFVGEVRFREQAIIRAILEPARRVAWRYYCLLYPGRLGGGLFVWEGVSKEGEVRWADFATGKKPVFGE